MRTSIIIAAHNEGESLWKTVQSCIETCAGLDYEIVIADDASVDDSVEEVQRRFSQLRMVRHEERRGTAPTKDLGAKEARGDIFVFLDGHCKPEYGTITRLVQGVEEMKGNAIVTPAVVGLDTQRWRNSPAQVGHGYFLDLEKFHCGWLPLSELRAVEIGRKRFYESPALIGCVLAVSRQLYEDLWGFDRHMRMWGVEDLDFGLKSWLMGHPILHDPEAVVGHRFRASFDNYDVPVEHTVVNQLRMARKSFTPGVWAEWVDRCRLRHPGRLADRPEGLWARVWELFEEQRASVEQERAYLHARRQRDEFWYAQRFGLTWPRLHSAPFASTIPAAVPAEAMALAVGPSPSPPPGPPVIQPGFPPGQPIACQPACKGGCRGFGVPQWNLNLFSLNLILRDTPAFYTPGLGPKISWDLIYNSQDPNAASSPFTYLFGAGVWSPYQTHAIDLGTQAHVVMPDGREDYYLPVDLSTNPIVYTPASGTGIYNQLTKNTTTNQFQLVLTDHSVLAFGKPFTSGGTSYYAVTRIADNVGNAVALAYTSDAVPKLSTITDANGNVSQVVYNSAGLASQINDPFGANVRFSYTTVGGLTRLASITDQAGYTSL
jgi:GT2 family glycosyltransferase